MNNKLIAVIVVIILLVAGVSAYFLTRDDDDDKTERVAMNGTLDVYGNANGDWTINSEDTDLLTLTHDFYGIRNQ